MALFTDPYSYSNVPSVDDDEWISVTKPLLDFMARVKNVTIDEVVEWGRENRYGGPRIRHMLAWLSFKDLVHYDYSSGNWRIGPPPLIAKSSTLSSTKPSGAETLIAPWKEADVWQPEQLERKRQRRKRN